ncbi:MAG: Ig-like domain-containing protein, partial [Proteobacteria bacterium]|nr:Ig-like domain-containing protein [Pseudomonadota bacterium]
DGSTLELNVRLRSSGRVLGRVLNADGLTPAPPSIVSIRVGGAGGGEQATLTDDAGRFVFDRVPAGSANLSVDVLGSPDRGIATLTVPSGGQVESLVELHGVGRLSGQALGPGGPAAGTLVVSGTGDATYSQTVAVGPDGSFVFPELLAGPFIASLTVSGLFPLYGSATGEILPDRDNSIEVRVQPSGTLGGRVVRSDGAPARGTEIRLDLLPNRGRRVLYARDDGSFEAAGVPLGAFTLHFRDPFTGGVAMMGSRLAQDKQALDVGVVTLDDTPVEAVAFVPADGATQVAVNAPIEVYFSDPLRSPQGITVSDGTSTLLARPQLSADGLKVTLRGRWTDASLITVTATAAVTDIHGRHPREPASASFRTVDLSPPRVASVVPIDGAIEVAPASSIEISFDEPLDPTASVLGVVTLSDGTSTLAGTTASPSAATLTFAPAALLLDDTRYTVRVNGARDPSGNLQTQAFTSTFATHDSQPPALSLSRPASGSWVNSARPRIVVDVTDSLSGVDPDSATLFVDGSQVQPSASPSQIRFTPSIDLADGQLAIEASIGDRAGNQASPLLEAFSIDTVAPEPAQLAGILNGAVLVGRVAFSATAADTGSGVARIRLLADDQPVMELERPFQGELDSSALADGPHALTARAVDQAGNVGPAGTPVEVTVDNRPIEVRITKPVANSRWRDTVHVSATPSEPVKRLVFSAGTSTVIDEAPPYQATLDLAGAPEGTAIITVTAVGLLDETAANTQTIIVDRTPPAPPDVTRIFAEPPDNGLSLVYGVAGAVESRATVNATNPATAATASSRASADGSFALFLEASVGDAVSLVAVDEAGNASAPSTVIVRATTTLPPAVATLRFLGSIVDRVGQGPAALAPDGQKDAVFELEFALGAGITRQLSFVDLQGPALRSTRVDVGSVLGVSEPDLGAPFLNEADGHVDLTISDNASFLLFAAREGLIQQGARYTATAVFTNGSRYIGELTLELPKHEVTSGTFGIANQALPSSISPGPPREEVASGVFALSNKHLLFPIGGTPGESHPAEAVSAVVSVKNGQLPVRVGGAPGVLQPTEAVSPIVSVRNVSLPPKPVDASGTPLVSEAVSPVVSLRNTLLPSVSVDPSGQSLPVEAVSSMVSVRNASLPVASDSSLSSEAVSQTVSVHNDPTAPPTIFPAAAQARGLGTQELGPGAPAANVPTSPAAGIGGGGVQNCPAGAGPCVAAFVRCPADAAACRPHTGFAGSGPIAGASMTWGAGLASDASTSVRRAGDASVDAGTAADGGTTTVSDAATNREVSP